MKKWLMLALIIAISSVALAAEKIMYPGVAYLEQGEEVFHSMDTKGLKEGDEVVLQDKYHPENTKKAKLKAVKEKSVIFVVL